jgi:soluble lytic murein transglycosylase-like protein
MRVPRATVSDCPPVRLERFEYARISDSWGIVRLLVARHSELGLLHSPYLAIGRDDIEQRALRVPAGVYESERRLESGCSASTLVWRLVFGAAPAAAEHPHASFDLYSADDLMLELGRPIHCDAMPRRLALGAPRVTARRRPAAAVARRRATALATAAALTATSTPAAALAASSGHGSTTRSSAGMGSTAPSSAGMTVATAAGSSSTTATATATATTTSSTTAATTTTTVPSSTTAATTTTTVPSSTTTTTTATTTTAPTTTTTTTTPTTTTSTTSTPTSTTTATLRRAAAAERRAAAHRAAVARQRRIDASAHRSEVLAVEAHRRLVRNRREHERAARQARRARAQQRRAARVKSAMPTVTELSPAPGYDGPTTWTGIVSANPALTGAVRDLAGLLSNGNRPPSFLIPIYLQASRRYHVPWQVLAAINAIETDYGRDLSTSTAGAVGWMQFEPSTWKRYGVAADGASEPNPYDPRDAIFAAARYLQAAGGEFDIRTAVYAYNHAGWYVNEVMQRAQAIAEHAQHEHTAVSRRGTVSVMFATGLVRHPQVRFSGGTLSHFDRLIAAANMVSAANFPYLWGGGHEQPARFGPFDCSGSVSYVMQQAGYRVPTTVAADVGSWHLPKGPGRVTIFYDASHTFMRIGGRYFGTSGFARPGGGAGWFDVNRLPVGYLAQFHEVHVPRLGVDSFSPSAEALAILRAKTPHQRQLAAWRRLARAERRTLTHSSGTRLTALPALEHSPQRLRPTS